MGYVPIDLNTAAHIQVLTHSVDHVCTYPSALGGEVDLLLQQSDQGLDHVPREGGMEGRREERG